MRHRTKKTKRQIDTAIRQWVRFHPHCRGARIRGTVHEVQSGASGSATWDYSYEYINTCADHELCDASIRALIAHLRDRHDLDLTPRVGPQEEDVLV